MRNINHLIVISNGQSRTEIAIAVDRHRADSFSAPLAIAADSSSANLTPRRLFLRPLAPAGAGAAAHRNRRRRAPPRAVDSAPDPPAADSYSSPPSTPTPPATRHRRRPPPIIICAIVDSFPSTHSPAPPSSPSASTPSSMSPAAPDAIVDSPSAHSPALPSSASASALSSTAPATPDCHRRRVFLLPISLSSTSLPLLFPISLPSTSRCLASLPATAASLLPITVQPLESAAACVKVIQPIL
ncbi:Os04g0498750 [Oryza sativa Japonica Group]|uniref:Os04g0498750 protein n=1 Tax=Oryza sativa subsp. japonica TaxID=39947 RepID=A0A0P0WCD4_ORYSJ|nr:Os04g0498750 [Oryza sativa Japonica Group]